MNFAFYAGKNPNAGFFFDTNAEGNVSCLVKSIRPIKAGDEILVDYGDEYFQKATLCIYPPDADPWDRVFFTHCVVDAYPGVSEIDIRQRISAINKYFEINGKYTMGNPDGR